MRINIYIAGTKNKKIVLSLLTRLKYNLGNTEQLGGS